MERSDFSKPAQGKPAPTDGRSVAVKYHDLAVESDHIAFLVDASDSMREPARKGQGASKSEVALQELEQVLGLLEDKLLFNVFVYDTTTRALAKDPVALDARSRKKALAFVEEASPRGPKDIWNALLSALEDSELDTVYLLASGEPEVGVYVHFNRIVMHLRELQRFQKFVIHGVVYTDSNWYAKQIEEICKSSGGEFRHVE